MSASSPRVFLSHAAGDLPDMQRLRMALEAEGILLEDDVLELRDAHAAEALRDALQGADAFLLYATAGNLGSAWLPQEVAWAHEMQKLDPRYRIVPILRAPLDQAALAPVLGTALRGALFIEEDADIDIIVPRILDALDKPAEDPNVLLASLPATARERIRELGVFRGTARLEVLAHVLRLPPTEAVELAQKLLAWKLGRRDGSYVRLSPGLCEALSSELSPAEREVAEARWLKAALGLLGYLHLQKQKDPSSTTPEIRTVLGELLAVLPLLEHEVAIGRAAWDEAMHHLAQFQELLDGLDLPRAQARVAATRRRLSARLTADQAVRLIGRVGQVLQVTGPAAVQRLIPEASETPADVAPVMRALSALVAGGRARSLADDPALSPDQAAELARVIAMLTAEPLCPCDSGRPFRECHGVAS